MAFRQAATTAAVIAALAGVSYGFAQIPGTFAPPKDVAAITKAVESGIELQIKGNAPQNCSFNEGTNASAGEHGEYGSKGVFGAGITVKGTEVTWYVSNTDNGYVCVGQIVNTASNSTTSINLLLELDSNGSRPVWPVGYSNTEGNVVQQSTVGSANLQSNNSIVLYLYNGNGFWLFSSEQQLATMNPIKGFNDPFVTIARQ